MRVVQLGPYPPPQGGVQTHIVALRRYLQARGIPCAVINLTRHRQADADEVYYPHNALAVLRLLVELPGDIVHLHVGGTIPPRLLALGVVCSLLPGRKAVFTCHSGGYPTSGPGRRARRATLRGFVFRRFDAVIAVNQELDAMFLKFGVSRQRLRLIGPHALPVRPPAGPLPPDLAAFVASHGPVLTTVGLLEPEYDLPMQIAVLGRVREYAPGAGLLIVGSGSLAADLRRQIEATPYRDHVRLCGDLDHDVTLRALAATDLFLRTTQYDGDSISVREALHLGVPVIATDNGMRPAGVRLIPAADLEALCDAIEQSLNEPRPAPATTAGGDENLEQVVALYRELSS